MYGIILQPGKTYELSFYGKNDQIASELHQNVFAVLYKDDWSWANPSLNLPTTTKYVKASSTFTIPQNVMSSLRLTIYIKGGGSSPDKREGTGYAKDIMIRRVF